MASVAFTALALIVLLGRSWQSGLALFVLCALLVGIVRFMNNLNSPRVAVSRAAAEERAEVLRRSVPRVLLALARATTMEKVQACLTALGEESGLLAIAVVSAGDRRSHRLRWQASSAATSWRDETCTKFDISDGCDALEVQFITDGTTGVVGPTTRILLQLVADRVEASLIACLEESTTERSEIRTEGQILLPGQ
jgi:hypothetical protein